MQVDLPEIRFARTNNSQARSVRFAAYLETVGFGCLITAAAGLVPLVMMLHW